MRHSLLAAAALLLVAASAAASSDHAGGSALQAPDQLASVFRFDVFDDTGASEVADRLSESLASAARGFSGAATPAELQRLAAQHRRLDGLQMRMEDAKQLVDWTGAFGHLAAAEQQIQRCSELLDELLSDAGAETQQQQQRSSFVREFAQSREAGRRLLEAVAESQGLAAAAAERTERHRPKVTSLLLHVVRLVLRAAEMEVAFEEMAGSRQEAARLLAQWQADVRRMVDSVHRTDRDIQFSWLAQARQDMERIIRENAGLSNQQFSRPLFNHLASKYPSRRWFVLNYQLVQQVRHHASAVCHGGTFMGTHGRRNVLVASSNPRTSRFNTQFAEGLLESVDEGVRTADARVYVNTMNNIIDQYCDDAAARIAVCHGCNVWGVHTAGRLAYRCASLRSNGRCDYHTYLFG